MPKNWRNSLSWLVASHLVSYEGCSVTWQKEFNLTRLLHTHTHQTYTKAQRVKTSAGFDNYISRLPQFLAWMMYRKIFRQAALYFSLFFFFSFFLLLLPQFCQQTTTTATATAPDRRWNKAVQTQQPKFDSGRFFVSLFFLFFFFWVPTLSCPACWPDFNWIYREQLERSLHNMPIFIYLLLSPSLPVSLSSPLLCHLSRQNYNSISRRLQLLSLS